MLDVYPVDSKEIDRMEVDWKVDWKKMEEKMEEDWKEGDWKELDSVPMKRQGLVG